MGELQGVLYVRVTKGSNLVIGDVLFKSSDPYVVLRLGQQAKKTGVKFSSLNPVWDEELKFNINNISDSDLCSLTAEVWDKDTLKWDDLLGVAQIDLKPLVEESYPIGNGKKVVAQSNSNCLANDSYIVQQQDGRIVQDVRLNLKLSREISGLLEMRLEWQPGP